MELTQVKVGISTFTVNDFSFAKCRVSEIDLPVEGIIISMVIAPDRWLNIEVHPHEWHFRDLIDWILWAGAAFALIGGVGVYVLRRIGKPMDDLTQAARQFGSGLQVATIEEGGPPDVKRAIAAFNAMQEQVKDEVARRTNTLAAIGHDIRTPLTALRVKVELIEDSQIRDDLVRSVRKMEKISTSALSYLKGESEGEEKKLVDLHTLIESECSDFIDLGENVSFSGEPGLNYNCRPVAMAGAIRNLLENAIKYGGSAKVVLSSSVDAVKISVQDQGPGISQEDIQRACEPFVRLSSGRESEKGGFGIGIAIVTAVVKGHDGELNFSQNTPNGLIVDIILSR
jgi:signal transduction histidine kinase